MVCIRFSAWSKTMECGDSNTSSVTSRASSPVLLVDLPPTLVCRSWNAGQAVHELHAAGSRSRSARPRSPGRARAGRCVRPRPPSARPSTPTRRCRRSRRRRTPSATSSVSGDPGAGLRGDALAACDDSAVFQSAAARRCARPCPSSRRRRAASCRCCCGRRRGRRRRSPRRLGGVLAHGEHVAEHLGRVPLVGEPVPDRHTGVRRERLDVRLAEPRYSMPSYIRPRTRAVSATDSLCPICEPAGRGR